MRYSGPIVARALHSVSQRYRHAWNAYEGPSRPSHFPRLASQAGSDEYSSDTHGVGVSRPRDESIIHLEAVLFLATQPLTSRKMAQLAGLADGTKARTLVRTLNRLYDADGCAFRVEEVAGGFQLMTRPKFAPWLRRFQSAATEVRLSAPAMETLAVVAYCQPVLRAEVESIRGVQCDEVLRQLIERGLVRVAGRSQELGRPILYATTRRFLQIFGLRHLDELPRAAFFRKPKLSGGGAGADNESLTQPGNFQEAGEETNVKTTATRKFMIERKPTVAALAERNARDDDFEDFDDTAEEAEDDEDLDDDEDFDDDLDEDEDDDLDEDEDTWEEVEDDDEEEDDDEDDWDDDEDWDDDDEDWEDEEKESEPEKE